MSIKTSPFEVTDYLRNEDDYAHYLAAVIEDDAQYEPALLPVALGDVAKAIGMTEVARRTGLSRETLYKILAEDGNPTYTTLCKLLEAFGVRMQFVQAPHPTKSTPRKRKPATRTNRLAVSTQQ